MRAKSSYANLRPIVSFWVANEIQVYPSLFVAEQFRGKALAKKTFKNSQVWKLYFLATFCSKQFIQVNAEPGFLGPT